MKINKFVKNTALGVLIGISASKIIDATVDLTVNWFKGRKQKKQAQKDGFEETK